MGWNGLEWDAFSAYHDPALEASMYVYVYSAFAAAVAVAGLSGRHVYSSRGVPLLVSPFLNGTWGERGWVRCCVHTAEA